MTTATEAASGGTASDGSLLRQFRQGSEQAAATLYGRYVERLRVLAKTNLSRSLARRVDPEDVVQSAFRCFFQAVSRGSYDLPSGEDLWSLLLVIALNRIRVKEGFHRAAKRDIRLTTDVGSFDPTAYMRQTRNSGSREFLRLVMREALDRLPSHHRTVIQLRMEGYEVAEIARLVVRSKRTVERILQESRIQLRVLLDEEESQHDEPSAAEMAGDR